MDLSLISNKEHRKILHTMLPTDAGRFEGVVLNTESLANGFSVIIRLNVETKEDALCWLKCFQEKSQLTFRVERTHPENTQKIVFKKQYHCVHNTKPKKNTTPHKKHLNCNAKLTVTVKNKKMKWSKDTLLNRFPCEVLLRNSHSHPIYSIPNIKLEKHSRECHEIVVDDIKCPTEEWVSDLNYQECGEPTRKKMIQSAEETVNQYSASTCSESSSQITEKNPNEIHEGLQEFVDLLMKKYENNFDEYHRPVSKFLENVKSCKAEDARLISALKTFGEKQSNKILDDTLSQETQLKERSTVRRPSNRSLLLDHDYSKLSVISKKIDNFENKNEAADSLFEILFY